jgi:PAS domain S-box-containing protein
MTRNGEVSPVIGDGMEPNYRVEAEITRSVFDHGPDAIIVVDVRGTILAANEQAALLTGVQRSSLVGQVLETLVPSDLREVHQQHRQGFLRSPYRRAMGPGLELSIMQRTDAGDVAIPVDVNLSPSVISIGTIVVATIRLRNESSDTPAIGENQQGTDT